MRKIPAMASVQLVFAVFAAVVSAQAKRAAVEEPGEMRVESALSILPRVSGMWGVVDNVDDWRYEDFWKTGFGLSIEGDILFPIGHNWKVGIYLSTGFDVFAGDKVTDDVGDSLDADNLVTSHYFLGFISMHAPPKGLFFDGRLGFGAVSYGQATGTLRISGVPVDVDIFDASTVFGAELGAHLGYSAPHMYFAAGFAVRTQGKPKESNDLAFEGTGNPVVGSFELELGFKF